MWVWGSCGSRTDRSLRQLRGAAQPGRSGPEVAIVLRFDPRESSPGGGIVRVVLQGFFVVLAGLFQFVGDIKLSKSPISAPTAQVGTISRRILGVAMLYGLLFLRGERHIIQCFGNLDGGRSCRPKTSFKWPVKSYGPDLDSIGGVNDRTVMRPGWRT